MTLRGNSRLRLGGTYQLASRDPEALVDFCRQEGFSAVYDPGVEDRIQLEEIKAAFAEHDIVIAETGAYAINILEPDLAAREANIAAICRRLERAEEVGSICCVAHGGSVGAGRWGAQSPENFGRASFDATVEIVQRIVDAVKPTRTVFCLETESRLLPDSPEVYLELITAVDRPAFQAHLDPINITSSPRRFYFNGEFLRDCFAKLGPHVVSCHAKDLVMTRDTQVHFEETFAGNGGIDFQTYISELARTPYDAPLMIEHSPGRQQAWARDYIFEQAALVGVPIRNAELRGAP